MMIWIGWTLEGLLGDFVEGWGTMTAMTGLTVAIITTTTAITTINGTGDKDSDDEIEMRFEGSTGEPGRSIAFITEEA